MTFAPASCSKTVSSGSREDRGTFFSKLKRYSKPWQPPSYTLTRRAVSESGEAGPAFDASCFNRRTARGVSLRIGTAASAKAAAAFEEEEEAGEAKAACCCLSGLVRVLKGLLVRANAADADGREDDSARSRTEEEPPDRATVFVNELATSRHPGIARAEVRFILGRMKAENVEICFSRVSGKYLKTKPSNRVALT